MVDLSIVMLIYQRLPVRSSVWLGVPVENVWNPAGRQETAAKHGGSYPAENLLQELIFHQPI